MEAYRVAPKLLHAARGNMVFVLQSFPEAHIPLSTLQSPTKVFSTHPEFPQLICTELWLATPSAITPDHTLSPALRCIFIAPYCSP